MRTLSRHCIRILAAAAALVGVWPYAHAQDSPDLVDLDRLANLYAPVAFDHAMHLEVASCAACHHHTAGAPAEAAACVRCHDQGIDNGPVACRDCHGARPLEAASGRPEQAAASTFHNERTGLKRAYHLSCMGCHREVGGPIGCEDCHARQGRETK
ncbi:MAG: cytochrome c3 family protein [Thermodesulfobacteriota bacterium]